MQFIRQRTLHLVSEVGVFIGKPIVAIECEEYDREAPVQVIARAKIVNRKAENLSRPSVF